MMLKQLWRRAFLDARPSLSLGLFRVAVAWTVAAHMIPSFFHMDENFLSTAFKTQNYSFFPVPVLRLVAASPDWMVWLWAAVFLIALMAFALGLFSQISCIAMTAACYYFYALNNFQIGTLSFDILLVTLFLMCVTSYPGDFLSIDSLRRGKPAAYKRARPFFIQRLLQLQLAWTFWFTALSKTHWLHDPRTHMIGNWFTDNPYYYLMHYPAIGVVRAFPFRDWLAQQPQLCHGIGVFVLVCELVVPLLWFVRKTRVFGIALGFIFHLLLWGTLHVPTLFLFLFPPMMLLFIEPETIVRWIESRQEHHALAERGMLLYDGNCGFCLESIKRVRVLDIFGWVDPLNFHKQPDLFKLHPALTPERCRSEMILIEPNGRISGGFGAFRQLTRHLPMLWILSPLAYLPGAAWAGNRVYRWVSEHRYLLHKNPICTSNQCSLPHPPAHTQDISSN